MSLDKQLRDLFAKHGVELAADDHWKVQSATVVRHKALERLAAAANVSWDMPNVIRATEDEAVILVAGRIGDRLEWSMGEAKIGANYRVSGKQAAYLWSMAEKRGKDRVILKLVGLHGFYSEEEAEDFKAPALAPESPQDGLQKWGRIQAAKGTAAYSAWFLALTKADKAALVEGGEHARNKSTAMNADGEAA